MSRRRGKSAKPDHGRGFYETSSPFETYRPEAGKPSTFSGQVDKSVIFPRNGRSPYTGPMVKADIDPQQYDNPRGYPGLKMVTFGSDKPEIPIRSSHTIDHQLSQSGKLTRTGK